MKTTEHQKRKSKKQYSRLPLHNKCYFCHKTLINLKGSYRHAHSDDALICVKIRDDRRICDELGYDLFYGEYRQVRQIDKDSRVYVTKS